MAQPDHPCCLQGLFEDLPLGVLGLLFIKAESTQLTSGDSLDLLLLASIASSWFMVRGGRNVLDWSMGLCLSDGEPVYHRESCFCSWVSSS